MQAKYFAGTTLLHASIKSNCSWAWNGIQKQISFIKKHSRWRLGKGDKIKIWLDVWIAGMDSPPVPRNEIMDSENFIWVQELIINDGSQWNEELVMHLFDTPTANLILDMRIPSSAEDKLIWSLTRNGVFTLKSAYNKLFDESRGTQQSSIFIPGTDIKWKDFWGFKFGQGQSTFFGNV